MEIYDSEMLYKDIAQYKQMESASVEIIGETVLKKPIYSVTVGKGPFLVHWNAGFHGNEWITSKVIMDILGELVEALEDGRELEGLNVRKIFDQITLQVVPMVNMDGVDLAIHGLEKAGGYTDLVLNCNQINKTFTSWKANIRGVDLNKQFPAGWKVEKERKPAQPSFRDFPGYSPLTEPEARAMADLLKNNEIERVLCFHSQGEVIYFGYQNKRPMNSQRVVENFQRASGYEPICTFDSHAGMKDWFIDNYRKEGYTIEVGKGINPLPLSQYTSILNKVRPIALLSLLPN
ncbi:M14 family metallopeptidase [Thalassobacillus devorans]|uniref:M14 family metallopeptidase n=1 Tax=Thalassobacillus devorans TaxID=279813 RepID=UPI000A1CB79E|nr:M14 family metallocarboxypeptidase [Thalassobacillus devorans]